MSLAVIPDPTTSFKVFASTQWPLRSQWLCNYNGTTRLCPYKASQWFSIESALTESGVVTIEIKLSIQGAFAMQGICIHLMIHFVECREVYTTLKKATCWTSTMLNVIFHVPVRSCQLLEQCDISLSTWSNKSLFWVQIFMENTRTILTAVPHENLSGIVMEHSRTTWLLPPILTGVENMFCENRFYAFTCKKVKNVLWDTMRD